MRTITLALAVAISLQATDVVHLRDQGADAFFTAFNGCVVATYQVGANANKNQSPGSPGQQQSTAFLAISRFDVCTQTSLMFAAGTAPLTSTEFQIDQSLDSASLRVSFPMQDSVSGQTFTADVSLTWSATDALTQGMSVFHTSAPGMRVNGRSHGWSRTAVASGRVVIAGQEVVLDSAVFAGLRKSTSGTVTIN